MAQQFKRKERKSLLNRTWLPLLCVPLLGFGASGKALAQGLPAVNLVGNNTPVLLAQGVTTPGVLPTDATKGAQLLERANAYPGFKLRLFQKLPANLWINGSTEVNQRLDTNVFLKYKEPQPDYVFRVAPNLTVGYNPRRFNNTGVYAQYFVIKDVYTVHYKQLTPPTTQSIAMGLRHTQYPKLFKNRVQFVYDIQARELFQSRGLRQADLTPSFSATWFATPKLTLFSSTTLQMRSGQLFGGPQREMDPFYTVGGYYRSANGKWLFSVTDTFVTNFREPHFKYSIPKQGNVNMIADFEIDRTIGNIPGLQAFIRAEPVWNWRSNNVTGLSGFDFRLYSGLRLSFYKPPLGATMDMIKKSLQQQDGDAAAAAAKKNAKKNKGKKGSGTSDPGKDGTTPPGESKPGETVPGGTGDPKNTSQTPTTDPSVTTTVESAVLPPAEPTTSMVPVSAPAAPVAVDQAQKTALETQAKSL
ncbi:MAG: hypothetical protein JSS83_01305 [Cyanobacteria bacterium SZAS LIN-3]|nr:hypothetical protein [Cyanobacteria bacterium SZAS LIN-3]MBS2005640.1 hypothetical protein [Cyanobacteria bacterium SZAS TMP-1]